MLLDFSSSSTLEGMLKCLLLVADTSHVVAEIKTRPAENDMASLAAQGMGGVWKTFAPRGLGNDEELRQHFVGGIYFIGIWS